MMKNDLTKRRLVVAAVDDILFVSKIRAVAQHLETDIRFARDADAVLSSALEEQPALIVVDLQSQKIDAIELAKKLKADARLSGIPLIGFFSHVMVELQRTASEAGFDSVLPRSVFSRDLATILAGDSQA